MKPELPGALRGQCQLQAPNPEATALSASPSVSPQTTPSSPVLSYYSPRHQPSLDNGPGHPQPPPPSTFANHPNLQVKSESLLPGSFPFSHTPSGSDSPQDCLLSPEIPSYHLHQTRVQELIFIPAQHLLSAWVDEPNRPPPAALSQTRPRGFRLS